MDRFGRTPVTCPRCSARVRRGDAWCSLCYGKLEVPEAVRLPRQLPRSVDPSPSGNVRTGRSARAEAGLVGGVVPDEMLADLTARLCGESGGGLRVPWRRPGVAALVGGVAVLVVLLVTMTLLGLLF